MFSSFLCLKGHRQNLSESGVSCSESVSVVLHYTAIFASKQINDDDDDEEKRTARTTTW